MLSGLFEKLKSGLTKTRQSFTEKVSAILHLHLTINDDLYDELEELLVTADIGIDTSMEIIDKLKKSIMDNKIKDPALVNACLKGVLLQILEKEEKTDLFNKERNILLIIGVNGVGKTTSIGKLAAKLKG